MKFFDGSKNILDQHAPLKEKTISFMEHAPWFDSEYKDLRKLRRKAEKKRNEDDQYQILYEDIRAETSIMANLKKQQYYSSLLDKNKHDTNLIFNIVNKELDRKQQSPLPATDDIPLKLCSKFKACLQPEKTHGYQYLFAVQFFKSYVYRGRINKGY